jgi:hypothetical protein
MNHPIDVFIGQLCLQDMLSSLTFVRFSDVDWLQLFLSLLIGSAPNLWVSRFPFRESPRVIISRKPYSNSQPRDIYRLSSSWMDKRYHPSVKMANSLQNFFVVEEHTQYSMSRFYQE